MLRKKRVNRNTIIIFLLIFLSFSVDIFSQLLFRDDFQTKNSYWYWRSDGNQQKPTVQNGLLKLELLNAVNSEYCNTEIYDPTEPYGPGTQVRIRLKASSIHSGSRGWGFWDGDIDIPSLLYDYDVAWIMQQGSDSSGTDYNWFQFGVNKDSINNRQIIDLTELLDETKWHTYKITWKDRLVSLHIDNRLVFVTNQTIPDEKMRVDIWIDNRVLNLSNPANYRNTNSDSSEMLVDFVEVTGLEGPEISRTLPNNVIFWNSPNSFPIGENNSLWKKFNINSSSEGKAYLFLTGSAENYKSIMEYDELKVKFNGKDFGWKNNFSLDGKVLKGKGKSILMEVDLKTNNLLKIITNKTPFLKDIILLHSPKGKLIFSKEYNETAKTNDGLWKTIEVNAAESSNAVLLLSGEAEKNDAIKIIVDNKDYGWNGEFSIAGNKLKGYPNTVALELNLKQGKHKIEIHKKGKPILYTAVIYGTSTLTDIDNEEAVASELKLTANPNPFNNATIINYTLPQSGRTNISIYNSIGQLVETIINENKNKGSYKLNWNAENISSGLYFCVIKLESKVKVHKLMLLK
ncbi:MAG: hypothetical protein CR986_09745 [Ignavibacteriae bacterium]|nr:MAG: hypothetical protein CR986_09745 [Ignavibacteriota bacterium]